MSKNTERNDDAVLEAMMVERSRLEADTGSYYASRKLEGACSMTVHTLVRRTGLTEGKVRGALLRLQAAGLVEGHGGSHRSGAEYATAAEAAALKTRKQDERIAHILEQVGSVDVLRMVVVDRCDRLTKVAANLKRVAEQSDDVLGLDDLRCRLGAALGNRALRLGVDEDDAY